MTLPPPPPAIVQTDSCIVAGLNGLAEAHPYLHLAWLPKGAAEDLAGAYLAHYKTWVPACTAATGTVFAIISEVEGYK